jgi:hypothetical protein
MIYKVRGLKMKYGYDEKDQVEDEEVTFTIKCTMRKRWGIFLIHMKEIV